MGSHITYKVYRKIVQNYKKFYIYICANLVVKSALKF